MALHRIPLLGNALSKSAAAYWAPYSAYNASTVRDIGVWIFQDAATGTVSVGFAVPKNWVAGSTKLVLEWSSKTAAGNVVWNVTHRAAATAIMNTNTSPASRTDALTTSSKPGSASRLEEDAITLTDTDWAVDSFVAMDIIRLGSDGSDTKTDSAVLFGAVLEYADS
ncbi:hypothetical protein [Defluviimonas sp. SAOS-178_SWC]|uniref:hypothetical protein n=1 Tax=Defluviimonas sp. SAOS-178_SWC TaxID=3121287 RepID=UPI0032215306